MGVLPKTRKRNPNSVYFLFREDIRFIRNISQEARLLVKNGIDTAEQLTAHKDELSRQIISLSEERKHLRSAARSAGGEDKRAEIKAEIAALSQGIGELRKEVRHCNNIKMRSADMKTKIRRVANEQKKSKSERKKVNMNDTLRRRR
jgi:hypothetical protein